MESSTEYELLKLVGEKAEDISSEDLSQCVVNKERGVVYDNLQQIKKSNDCIEHDSPWYAYVNKVYLDLTFKIEREQTRIDTVVRETYGNKLTEIQSKIDSSIASLNHRMIILEEDVEKIKTSFNELRKSIHVAEVKNIDVESMKIAIEEVKAVSDSLQDKVKTNRDLTDTKFNDFVLFKQDFNDNVIPILDRLNQGFIDKSIFIPDNINNIPPISNDKVATKLTEIVDENRINQTDPLFVESPRLHESTDENIPVGNGYQLFQSGNGKQRSPGYQQHLTNKDHESPEEIDCEVLFLTDSNCHRMKADI